MMKPLIPFFLVAAFVVDLQAAEFHVAIAGKDSNSGAQNAPLRTIQHAADLAQPGDVITVHAGIYRERVTPPRGGESHAKRIVYRAAAGETVIIKGSEVVRDWKPFATGVWKATLPNSFFGAYNPYKDLIAGDWFIDNGRPHHTGEVYLNGKSLFETHLLDGVRNPRPLPEACDPQGSTFTWFCESDEANTHLYANFHDKNPNQELVEINVCDACFYPDRPGCNYITIRGFRMCHAATQWAAPTAEQIGLVGTHWSKGWIIENNVISDSKCCGISLGKDRATGHNVWSSNPRKDGGTHYIEVILRALSAGWSREKIGSHVVRNNVISNCEQAGIIGSLGAVFSQITDNHIHDIWAKRQFTGHEMGGIKLHGAIDVVIRHNCIHRAGRGLWMDWMAQGARITGNLLYDNSTDDLYVEVDHGPFLVDNNLLLSNVSLKDVSQGGAYAHNLITGRISTEAALNRFTPYHQPHSTALAGVSSIKGGDDRFYDNVFAGQAEPPARGQKREGRSSARATGFGLWVYDTREFPLQTGGNAYYRGARPYAKEAHPLTLPSINPKPEISEQADGVYLRLTLGQSSPEAGTTLVTTKLLEKARIPGLAYENPDGSPLKIDTDYFGQPRDAQAPTAGPFEQPASGQLRLKVW